MSLEDIIHAPSDVTWARLFCRVNLSAWCTTLEIQIATFKNRFSCRAEKLTSWNRRTGSRRKDSGFTQLLPTYIKSSWNAEEKTQVFTQWTVCCCQYIKSSWNGEGFTQSMDRTWCCQHIKSTWNGSQIHKTLFHQRAGGVDRGRVPGEKRWFPGICLNFYLSLSTFVYLYLFKLVLIFVQMVFYSDMDDHDGLKSTINSQHNQLCDYPI